MLAAGMLSFTALGVVAPAPRLLLPPVIVLWFVEVVLPVVGMVNFTVLEETLLEPKLLTCTMPVFLVGATSFALSPVPPPPPCWARA